VKSLLLLYTPQCVKHAALDTRRRRVQPTAAIGRTSSFFLFSPYKDAPKNTGQKPPPEDFADTKIGLATLKLVVNFVGEL